MDARTVTGFDRFDDPMTYKIRCAAAFWEMRAGLRDHAAVLACGHCLDRPDYSPTGHMVRGEDEDGAPVLLVAMREIG